MENNYPIISDLPKFNNIGMASFYNLYKKFGFDPLIGTINRNKIKMNIKDLEIYLNKIQDYYQNDKDKIIARNVANSIGPIFSEKVPEGKIMLEEGWFKLFDCSIMKKLPKNFINLILCALNNIEENDKKITIINITKNFKTKKDKLIAFLNYIGASDDNKEFIIESFENDDDIEEFNNNLQSFFDEVNKDIKILLTKQNIFNNYPDIKEIFVEMKNNNIYITLEIK